MVQTIYNIIKADGVTISFESLFAGIAGKENNESEFIIEIHEIA